jgi:hypothetical protein
MVLLLPAVPLDLVAKGLGEAFDQPAGHPRNHASRIDPKGQLRARQRPLPHLSDDGLILDTKYVTLPEDPAISPGGLPIVPQLRCAVGNVHYRFGGERLLFYVYVFGR